MEKVKIRKKLETELDKTLSRLRPLVQKQWTAEGLTELEFEQMIELEATKKILFRVLAMLEYC